VDSVWNTHIVTQTMPAHRSFLKEQEVAPDASPKAVLWDTMCWHLPSDDVGIPYNSAARSSGLSDGNVFSIGEGSAIS